MTTNSDTNLRMIPENFEASKGKRFVNYLIDYIIFGGFPAILIIQLEGHSELLKRYDGLFFIVYFFVYFLLTEYYMGKTIGKFITRTTVVVENFEKPSFLKIFIRTLCRFIPLEPISAIISYNPWHDSISKTYVVNDKRN